MNERLREKHTEYIACSLDKKDLFEKVEAEFNQIEFENANGQFFSLKFSFYPDEDVIRWAVYRDFGIICPDSVFSLDEIETQWQEKYGNQDGSVIEQQIAFASSPLVFFMSPRAIEKFKVSEKPMGWKTLLQLADSNVEFELMHAKGLSNNGQPVALAQFIATQANHNHSYLNELDDTALQQVRALQQRVREYGPSDSHVLRRAFKEGEWQTDLVIAQERSILQAATNTPSIRGTLIYPQEGTVWIDQSFSLMRHWENPKTQEVFQKLQRYLSSPNCDNFYTENKLHSKRSNQLGSKSEVEAFYKIQPSPIQQRIKRINYGAAPMVLPGRRVVRSINELWGNVEKPADVCLIVDVSGSMDASAKIGLLKSGLSKFLQRFRSPQSTVGLVEFESSAKVLAPLQLAVVNRFNLDGIITKLQPRGQTALLDAIHLGIQELELLGNPSHLQVIIALTDGQENNSHISLSQIQSRLTTQTGIRFYGIAYGQDADRSILEKLANMTGGMVCSGAISDIEKIYKQLSQYI